MKNKKILIVGDLYPLIKKFSQEVEKLYVIPGNSFVSEFAECVDIREDNPLEILSFVLNNNIDFTIAVSEKSIMADIAGVFQANETPIFAPSAKSAEIATHKSLGKKFLYKLHAPTPKFGVFDKLPLILDYLKNAKYPLIISRDCESKTVKDRLCCTRFEHAKYFAEELLCDENEKLVVEEYVYGHEFTYYAISDGYHVLPLTSVSAFKFTENGDGGLLTSGVGCYVPGIHASSEILEDLFDSVIKPAVNSLESKGIPYVGILGVDAVIAPDGTCQVLDFKPFLRDFDAQAVINSLDEDLIDLFEACANGFFADEYEDILVNDNISASCVVSSRFQGFEIPNLLYVDSAVTPINLEIKSNKYISKSGKNLVLTSKAKTLSRAKMLLTEDVESIKFNGIKTRSDIYC